MVFDKLNINDQTFEAEGQLTVEQPSVRITTTDGDVGLFFNQLETSQSIDSIAVFKGDEERYSSSRIKVSNLTVVGGNYRIELEETSD
ncbi:hypothetical protein [Macrococcus equipercicus]|uniref:Uncharacterized protein n=1 Tax=Macrococcus equipercicus TaxID=69967 RepID=A0A9Q9F2E2_9STAP|nr:hypothetical protein [Macrococcus equipercicus]KAA1036979.1 hypothetical protein ERX35_010010 [Macrococcus equipercicus]UTH14695.1 hypothetical protein KFV11_04895 [Macrococcus equipercicus]